MTARVFVNLLIDLLRSRPGILVLINDADWELEGEENYEVQPGDNILFVSTLHGGWILQPDDHAWTMLWKRTSEHNGWIKTKDERTQWCPPDTRELLHSPSKDLPKILLLILTLRGLVQTFQIDIQLARVERRSLPLCIFYQFHIKPWSRCQEICVWRLSQSH